MYASSIGFVLCTFNRPTQFLRLVRRLNALYDDPPICCHHDFGQCSLDGLEFPPNVRFVRPHFKTRWGAYSCSLGFRAALGLLYDGGNSPDWFVFLSAADYPVRAAQHVRDELDASGYDAYIDHRLVERPFTPDPGTVYEKHSFKSAGWVPMAYKRYVGFPLWLPWYLWQEKRPTKLPIGTIHANRLIFPIHPFGGSLRCYGGEAWFTGNRKAAARLLADDDTNRSLLRHYSRRFISEESLPHTMLCNDPDLRVSTENFRYIDWSKGGATPKVLGMEDVPRILASGAHFARKFGPPHGDEVMDAIDAAIDSSRSRIARTASLVEA